MGYAERVTARRWEWLYRQPLWRRVAFALRWFRSPQRRRMFRGRFRAWLLRGGHPPQWTAIGADHAMIRAAQRQAREAARHARQPAHPVCNIKKGDKVPNVQ